MEICLSDVRYFYLSFLSGQCLGLVYGRVIPIDAT